MLQFLTGDAGWYMLTYIMAVERLFVSVCCRDKEKGNVPHIVSCERLMINQDDEHGLYGCWFLRPNETFHLATRKFLQKVWNLRLFTLICHCSAAFCISQLFLFCEQVEYSLQWCYVMSGWAPKLHSLSSTKSGGLTGFPSYIMNVFHKQLECGPMLNLMAALLNIDGAICLFNAFKFGWHPLLECCAVMLPRCETHWN